MSTSTYDTNVNGIVDAAESVPWTGVTGTPSTFPPSAHSHTIADTTGLQTALDNKIDDSQISAFGLTLVDDANAATARSTLGLGTAATSNTGDFAVSGHTHSGFVPTGGTAGQVLKKITATDYDYSWQADNTGTGLSDGDKGDVTVTGSGTIWTIDNNTITNAKLSDVATSTIKGRVTASTGDPEDLTPTQVRTLINVADGANNYAHPNHSGDVTSLGDGATTIVSNAVTNTKLADVPTATFKGRTTAGTGDPEDLTVTQAKALLNLTGTNSGDQTITLTGDVTGSGTGSFAATIANDVVTNAKAANMATSTVKGRVTAGTGDPEDLTTAQLTTLVDVFGTALKGAVPASGGGTTNFLRADGTWTAPPGVGGGVSDGDKGDITVSGTGTVWTIDNGTITNAKHENFPANSLQGNNTGASASPGYLTTAQVTAMLDLFTSALKGLVPASGGGTTNFLRADGTWAAPPGGSGGSPGGTSGEIQYNNAGVFAGAPNVEINSGNLQLVGTTTPTAPATGNLLVYAQAKAARLLPHIIGPSGLATSLQVATHGNSVFLVSPSNGTTAPTVVGGVLTTAATISHIQTIASANRWQATRRTRFQTNTTAGNASGMRTGYTQWFIGNATGFGGFFFRAQLGMNINLNGGQKFVGLCNSVAVLGGEPSALLNMCGMGYDSTDASTGNWFFMRNDGAGSATKVDLGANAARNTTHGYDLIMFVGPNSQTLNVQITNLDTNTLVLNTSYTTDLPAVNTGLSMKAEVRNGAQVAADNLEVAKIYIETDY
jgi:hypothetical protein